MEMSIHDEFPNSGTSSDAPIDKLKKDLKLISNPKKVGDDKEQFKINIVRADSPKVIFYSFPINALICDIDEQLWHK